MKRKFLFLILLFLCAGSAHAQITVTKRGDNIGSSSTATLTLGSFTATTGNLNVIAFNIQQTTETIGITTVTDSKLNTYTSAGCTATITSGSSHPLVAMYYSASPTVGATSVTVTVTGNTTSHTFAWTMYDLGGASATPLDTGGSAVACLSTQSSTASPSGPSSTTTIIASEAVITENSPTSGGITTTVASPFSLDFNDTSSTNASYAHDVVTSTGTYTPAWTYASTAKVWCGISAAFAAAASTSGVVKRKSAGIF